MARNSRIDTLAFVLAVVLCLAAVGVWVSKSNHKDSGAIRTISLDATVNPNRVVQGDDIRVSASLTINGGPGPVTFTGQIPKNGGGTHDYSFTVMLDANARYGFETPAFPMNLDPGQYTLTFSAKSGHISDTQQVTLVVDAPPVVGP